MKGNLTDTPIDCKPFLKQLLREAKLIDEDEDED